MVGFDGTDPITRATPRHRRAGGLRDARLCRILVFDNEKKRVGTKCVKS
jgi:hypothetical protein